MSFLNPSSSFAGLTDIPKHWGFHRCQRAPYTSNPVVFDGDGLKFTAPVDPSSWFGLASAGWHYPTTGTKDFDIELEYKEFVHDDQNQFGIGVRICRYMIDCVDIASESWLALYVIRSSGIDRVRFEQSSGGIIQTIDLADITAGKLRLTRVGNVFTAYYDIGHGSWQVFGTTWNSSSDTRYQEGRYRLDPTIRCYRNAVTAYPGAKLVSFTQNVGSPLPELGVDTPADDFADAVLPAQPKWSGYPPMRCGGTAQNVQETAGYLRWYLTTVSVTNWKHWVGNYALFPGTDIDLTVDLSLQQLDTWNNQDVRFTLYAHILRRDITPRTLTNGSEDINCFYVGVRLLRKGSTTNYARLCHCFGIGSAVVDGDVSLGTGLPSRHTIRLTRVGSTWSAYLDGSGSPFASFADPIGYLADNPLSTEIAAYMYTGGANEQRIYDLQFDAGDWTLTNPDYTSPWLDSEPISPNPDYYSSTPMTWVASDDYGPVSVSSLTIFGLTAITADVIQPGFSGTITVNGTNGVDISLLADSDIFPYGMVPWQITLFDAASNSITETGEFYNPSSIEVLSSSSLTHICEISRIDVVADLSPENSSYVYDGAGQLVRSASSYRGVLWHNQFDELGSLLSLKREPGEKNWEFKRRIRDAAVNQSNSSYIGLVNAITRDLGLTKYRAIEINPVRGRNENFLSPDPYILFSEPYLYLYSNYSEGEIDLQIDRLEPGGNYETLASLISAINTYSRCFTASGYAGVDTTSRSSCILDQSNRVVVRRFAVPASRRFWLGQRDLIRDTVFFDDSLVFHTEVDYVEDVTQQGSFHIDYTTGVTTTYSTPKQPSFAHYTYITVPFYAMASPVILSRLVSDDFNSKLFNQILQDDGTYIHGQPTPLGIQIIGEILSVKSMYWGN